MRASSFARHSSASPTSSVSETRPSPSRNCWNPGLTATYCASNRCASSSSCGHSASARARSSWVSGCFSTLTKCRRAPAGACRSNSCQAQRKFKPVPKPVSPMTRRSPGWSAAKRGARSFCARNTWLVSSMPETREKYTSPYWRDCGWPFSSHSSSACWKPAEAGRSDIERALAKSGDFTSGARVLAHIRCRSMTAAASGSPSLLLAC